MTVTVNGYVYLELSLSIPPTPNIYIIILPLSISPTLWKITRRGQYVYSLRS